MSDEGTAEEILEMLGSPFHISVVDRTSSSSLCEAAFELYKEAALVVNLTANVWADAECLERNQAICAGMLVRLAKFMTAVVQLCVPKRRGDVVLALNRCLGETALNLLFLIAKNDHKTFDNFVERSLGPEKELHEEIRRNIAQRDSTLPIEKRMMRSIEATFQVSGVSIDEAKTNPGNWSGDLRQKAKALGLDGAYVMLQRIPSHAVHGTWSDLITNHLRAVEGGFTPDNSWRAIDPRLLCPLAILVLKAVGAYLALYLADLAEMVQVEDRVKDLIDRTLAVNDWHEELLSKASESGDASGAVQI